MQEKIAQKGSFGDKLSRLLQDKGITQKDLAQAIGVTTAMVNRYIKRNVKPSLETIKKMSDYLTVPSDVLLDNTPIYLDDSDNDGGNDNSITWKMRALEAERKLSIIQEGFETLGATIADLAKIFSKT
ncbi:MAG: helix-turn-helix transcriptional regulator [Akkermansia sp.]|uniref:helix-turn-helix domain-containing protein n=1 Tax=Akkermansia sp. TaxID=1872421 RepID=UPI0025C6F321|nr:helix-turn-helix transcriptional regulator [Akkermansia sp.]MBS5509389.1 helix-turn-helix transcriptional regulator [Akkermansia sp.]